MGLTIFYYIMWLLHITMRLVSYHVIRLQQFLQKCLLDCREKMLEEARGTSSFWKKKIPAVKNVSHFISFYSKIIYIKCLKANGTITSNSSKFNIDPPDCCVFLNLLCKQVLLIYMEASFNFEMSENNFPNVREQTELKKLSPQ